MNKYKMRENFQYDPCLTTNHFPIFIIICPFYLNRNCVTVVQICRNEKTNLESSYGNYTILFDCLVVKR